MTLNLGKLTVMPESGRILKLEPLPGLNVLWSNPASGPDARGWLNPGGDRTWLSPERDLFLPDGSWKSYKVPAAIDPGKHEILELSEQGIALKNRIEARFFRQNACVGLTLTKRITETNPEAPGVEASAGYDTELGLRADEPLPPNVFVSLWSLLQLPRGGRIFFKGARPLSYFGRPAWRDAGGGVRFMEVPATEDSFKVGIEAIESQGVMAYLNLSVEKPFLVVKKFEVRPGGRYCDAPMDMPDAPCVQQMFSDNGDEGGFGELEHHSEAMAPGCVEISGRHSTMAFVAGRPALEKIMEALFR